MAALEEPAAELALVAEYNEEGEAVSDIRARAVTKVPRESDYHDTQWAFRAEGGTTGPVQPQPVTTSETRLKALLWNPAGLMRWPGVAKAFPRRAKTDRPAFVRPAVRDEWFGMIGERKPHIIVYPEAAIPGADKHKRRNTQQLVKELEQMHQNAGYVLYCAYAADGSAKYGNAIAIRADVWVGEATYGFAADGSANSEGRVINARIAAQTRPVGMRNEW